MLFIHIVDDTILRVLKTKAKGSILVFFLQLDYEYEFLKIILKSEIKC